MTKADIAKELYERNYKWLSRNEASDMVELLIETLKENLADGKMIKIAGFGTFIVRKKGERKGRNL
jgi:nucleoid DNA-binding protein